MAEMNFDFSGSLKPRKVTEVSTTKGYMQVLEYTLQDLSSLYVVQWNFMRDVQDDGFPIVNYRTYYNNTKDAFQFASGLGNELLNQF